MNKHVVAHAVSGAKRLHQRRLRSAVAVLCSTIEMNAWQSVFGPANWVIWEAGVLGTDGSALNALIDIRDQRRIDNIRNRMSRESSLPIAAE